MNVRFLRPLLQALGLVKRRSRVLMICPVCGKSGIRPGASLGYGVFPVTYVCDECGYRGNLVVEVEEDEEKEE